MVNANYLFLVQGGCYFKFYSTSLSPASFPGSTQYSTACNTENGRQAGIFPHVIGKING